MRLKSIAFIILLVLSGTALSQAALENTSAGSSPTNEQSAIQPFAFAVVLLLALFAGIPLILNTILAHKHLTEMHDSLDDFINKHPNFDEDKLVQIIHDCISADPSGAPGTARGTMALTITLIVGTALFFLVVYPPSEPTNNTIKEVLLTLTGALTAIIGFYFGGKATEAAQPTTTQPATTQPATTQPTTTQPTTTQPTTTQPTTTQPTTTQPTTTQPTTAQPTTTQPTTTQPTTTQPTTTQPTTTQPTTTQPTTAQPTTT